MCIACLRVSLNCLHRSRNLKSLSFLVTRTNRLHGNVIIKIELHLAEKRSKELPETQQLEMISLKISCDGGQAAEKPKGSPERLLLVMAFVAAGFPHDSIDAADQKPVEPLAGETFELIVPEKGAWHLVEQVLSLFYFVKYCAQFV